MKKLIREQGNQQAVEEQKWEYFKLWLRVGLRNPLQYMVAEVRQTMGYWAYRVRDYQYVYGEYFMVAAFSVSLRLKQSDASKITVVPIKIKIPLLRSRQTRSPDAKYAKCHNFPLYRLYKRGTRLLWLFIALLFYAVLPFNAVLTICMGKDEFFAISHRC